MFAKVSNVEKKKTDESVTYPYEPRKSFTCKQESKNIGASFKVGFTYVIS